MNEATQFSKGKKSAKFKRKIREKLQDARDWIDWHRDEVVTFMPVVVAGTATAIKVVGRRVNLHKQETIKNLYCYDRSLGHYWQLRRPLSNNEWLMIDARRKRGERMADILASMKVLK